MEGIIENIKEGFKQRISGFAGYFFLSWIAWNHKFLICIFTSSSLDTKLNKVDSLYSVNEYFYSWILYPMLSTIPIFIVFPWIAAGIDLYNHWVTAMKDVRKSKIISPEIVSQSDLMNFRLQNHTSLAQLQSRLKEATSDYSEAKSRLEEKCEEIDSLRNVLDSLQIENQALKAIIGHLSKEELEVIEFVGDSESGVFTEEVKKHIRATDGSFKCITTNLMKHSLINEARDKLHITEKGAFTYLKIKENKEIDYFDSMTQADKTLLISINDGFHSSSSEELASLDMSDDEFKASLNHLVKLGLVSTAEHSLGQIGYYSTRQGFLTIDRIKLLESEL